MSSSIAIGDAPRPTFLFIGADRCGSKSLHRFFRQHPDCNVPSIADPYFFDKNYERGLDWYWSLFAAAPQGARAIGEFSHDYIHSELAARRISAILPGVKLLATLRHPVERTFSSYASAANAMVIRGSFEQALEEVPMLIGNSLYADRLQAYLNLFDRERIKILLFDDLQANPRAFAADAFAHVGLRPDDSIDYAQRMNALWKSRWPLSGPISKGGAIALRRLVWVGVLGRLKGSPSVRAFFCKPYAADERPKIAPATRRRLTKSLPRRSIDWKECSLATCPRGAFDARLFNVWMQSND
jgi:hypothetical protein